MTRLRILLVAPALAASLALLAVWQAPQWLDWTPYRATIEVMASATLGQPVTIEGPISLTLLPQPVLTAAQVSVGEPGDTALSIRVDALRLRVALWPLVRGRVDARELVLRGADLHIPRLAESSGLLVRPPTWLAAARIENGRATVGRLVFTGIDATLATMETGALIASGTARFGGYGWNFTARMTSVGADGAAGLNATLDGEGKANGLGASFSGQLAADGSLAGSIASRGPDLAVLLPAPPVAFRTDGRLTVGGGLAAIHDLSLEIGGSPGSGSVTLRLAPRQRLDITLSASRFDLDAWLPVLMDAGTTITGLDLPIGLDVSADAAPLAGGTLEHLRAALDLGSRSLTVRHASTLLPGNGTLEITGNVALNDAAHARFEGDARLDAPVLRTTLRWLEGVAPRVLPAKGVAHLPDDVLQRATLAAHVVAGDDTLTLRQLDGSVDDASIAGSISLRHGEPSSISANLTLDHLLLDSWLPTLPPAPIALARLAGGLNADLRLGIREATLAGAVMQGISVDAAMQAGSFTLHRLAGNLNGMHVVAAGSLDPAGQLSDGSLSVATIDATPLSDLVPAPWRATPALWQGPAKLEVKAAGPPTALALGIKLSLADARLDADPTIDLHSGTWGGTVTLRHPGARRLLSTLGLPALAGLPELPAWLGDGSLSLVAQVAGAPGRLNAESFDVTAATLHSSGRLVFDDSGSKPHLSGHIGVDTLPLPMLDGGSEVSLPVGLLHGWRGDVHVDIGQVLAGSQPVGNHASASVVVANGALRIEQFAGELGGGTLTGRFSFDGTGEPPALSLQARLTNATITGPLADTPLDLLSGQVSGSVELSAGGYSPATILATLGGHLTLTSTDGAVGGFDLSRAKLAAENPDPVAAQTDAAAALGFGATAFDRLDIAASVAHGELTLDAARLHGNAGDVDLSGSMDLPSQTLDLRLELRPALPNPPAIAIRLAGPLDRATRTPELASLARFVAERAH